MTNLNTAFQEILKKRRIQLQKVERADGTIYKGRLALNKGGIVEFAFWIENADQVGTAQIIFNNLVPVEDASQRSSWLEKINELNRTHALYYYLVLDIDNRVFARYVTRIDSDELDRLFDVFKIGTRMIENIVVELRQGE